MQPEATNEQYNFTATELTNSAGAAGEAGKKKFQSSLSRPTNSSSPLNGHWFRDVSSLFLTSSTTTIKSFRNFLNNQLIANKQASTAANTTVIKSQSNLNYTSNFNATSSSSFETIIIHHESARLTCNKDSEL